MPGVSTRDAVGRPHGPISEVGVDLFRAFVLASLSEEVRKPCTVDRNRSCRAVQHLDNSLTRSHCDSAIDILILSPSNTRNAAETSKRVKVRVV